MGFGNDEPSQAEIDEDNQLKANQAEMEAKKQSLFQTRLDIIKGQGGENWNPADAGGRAQSGLTNPLSPNNPKLKMGGWNTK